MSYAPPQVVPGHPRENAPFGLFSAVTFRESADPHWQNGIEWEALTCDPASGIYDPSCENPPEKEFAPGFTTGNADPFTVYGSYLCGAIGRALTEAQEQATAHLLAREEQQAEAALLLQLPGSPVDLGTDLAPIVALGVAEQFIANTYGSRGTILTSRIGATVLAQAGAVRSVGGRLMTTLGTLVAALSAENDELLPPAAGPTIGTDTGALFALPALFGYRGPVFHSSSRPGDLMDRGRNDLYAVAERNYVIGYDPCGVGTATFNLECC